MKCLPKPMKRPGALKKALDAKAALAIPVTTIAKAYSPAMQARRGKQLRKFKK